MIQQTTQFIETLSVVDAIYYSATAIALVVIVCLIYTHRKDFLEIDGPFSDRENDNW